MFRVGRLCQTGGRQPGWAPRLRARFSRKKKAWASSSKGWVVLRPITFHDTCIFLAC